MTVRFSAYLFRASAALTQSPICFLSIEQVPTSLRAFLGLDVVRAFFVGLLWSILTGEDVRFIIFVSCTRRLKSLGVEAIKLPFVILPCRRAGQEADSGICKEMKERAKFKLEGMQKRF